MAFSAEVGKDHLLSPHFELSFNGRYPGKTKAQAQYPRQRTKTYCPGKKTPQ
jgi:hypothetical protein